MTTPTVIPLPKINKSRRILEILLERGAMRARDIQEELWKMSHPDIPFTRSLRGYWATNLYGGPMYHRGLLNVWATKNDHGLWVPKYRTVPRRPWKALGWRVDPSPFLQEAA